jgi:tetratricopeptide (TPR) repeat protein
MWKKFFQNLRTSSIALLSLLAFLAIAHQTSLGQSAGAQVLYGDLKVDEGQVSGMKPQTYYVILYLTNGNVIGRQTVTNGGRYRFLDVPNGEYDLVVEVENQEAARIHLVIHELSKTDVRRDIALEWRDNNRSTAKTSLPETLDVYPRSAANQTLFEKALEALRTNKADEGISLLKQIVQSDAKDYIAWTELGTAQFKKDSFSDAEKSYANALTEKPSYIVALMNSGKLKMMQKNFEGAIETFTNAVTAQPLSADANHYLGECYLQIKKGSKAVGYLNKALELDPLGKAEVHLRLAALYNGAGMKDKAAIEYEKFLQKKPDYPDKKKLQQYISENKK